jgi:ribosomal protein S18 acetylase RimI-like enzyme
MADHLIIQATDHPLFPQAWILYKKSFPPEERRQLRTQKKIMNHPLYRFEVITEKNQLTGIILWWNFDDVRYIEHIATSPRIRGKGYGLHLLNRFISESAIPVILEVEYPVSEINKRRIAFYQRTGFVCNPHPYRQPPYKKGGASIPMMLMSYPNALTASETTLFCKKYHSIIYNVSGPDF